MSTPSENARLVVEMESVLRAEARAEAIIEAAVATVEDNGAHPARPAGLRTRGVSLERVRPVRWLWTRRIPLGLLSLIVGDEGVGKGTLTSWLVARATRGELEGDMHKQPTRVLIIGDEDGFDQIWVPRLYAADADLDMLETLDDGEFVDDFASAAVPLAEAIKDRRIGLVLFDGIIDHIPGGAAGEAVYNPKNVRQALMPLRRLAASTEVAALGLLHPIKGNASTFRQLVAGSHQLNAVSRSSLLLAVDPEDDRRRVLVRGKGNHTAAPRAVEFAIAGDVFELNGYTFEMPKVVDLVESDRTVKDLLKSGPPEAPVRDELAEHLYDALTKEPQTLAGLARKVGRDPKDGSVRNALNWLHEQKRATRIEKGWIRGV
jgi:hypothetical protein